MDITCPNIPKLHNLEVCFPGSEIFSNHKFDLNETVETVSFYLYLLFLVLSIKLLDTIYFEIRYLPIYSVIIYNLVMKMITSLKLNEKLLT